MMMRFVISLLLPALLFAQNAVNLPTNELLSEPGPTFRIDAPDPLQKYRWYILGGFGIVLAAGALYIATRSKAAAIPDFAPTDAEFGIPPAPKPKPADRSALLLEALKEELFQLEIDRKQGQLSPAEYEKAKAALDQTLERALKRKSS